YQPGVEETEIFEYEITEKKPVPKKLKKKKAEKEELVEEVVEVIKHDGTKETITLYQPGVEETEIFEYEITEKKPVPKKPKKKKAPKEELVEEVVEVIKPDGTKETITLFQPGVEETEIFEYEITEKKPVPKKLKK